MTQLSTSKIPGGFTEETAQVNGVTLNYAIGGAGPTVVGAFGQAIPDQAQLYAGDVTGAVLPCGSLGRGGKPRTPAQAPAAVPRLAQRVQGGHMQLVSDADHLALSRLVVEIAWRIDHGQADKVWELFVADGVLDTSGTPLVGHDAIRNWGRARVASTVQTRHICSGMRFVDHGNGRATGSTLLTVFMHDGDGRGPAVPAVVGEDTDEFVGTDVGWRFASRTFEILFA